MPSNVATSAALRFPAANAASADGVGPRLALRASGELGHRGNRADAALELRLRLAAVERGALQRAGHDLAPDTRGLTDAPGEPLQRFTLEGLDDRVGRLTEKDVDAAGGVEEHLPVAAGARLAGARDATEDAGEGAHAQRLHHTAEKGVSHIANPQKNLHP